MYETFSYGDMSFDLPKGAFDYQGIQHGDMIFYGKEHQNICICCDVLISSCGMEEMGQYQLCETLLRDYPDTYKDILRQYTTAEMTISQGRSYRIFEKIVDNRTFMLYVKAAAGYYFRITVGKSYDRSIPVSQLRDFAYKILSTIRIDGGIYVSFENFNK